VAQVDEGQAHIRADGLAQVSRRFPDDHLQGGPDVALQQVAPAGASVRQAEDRVQMKLRAVRGRGDVADQGQDLALPGHRDVPVVVHRAVEPADHGALEAADGGHLRRLQVLLPGERAELGHCLVAGVKDRHIGRRWRRLDHSPVHRTPSFIPLS